MSAQTTNDSITLLELSWDGEKRSLFSKVEDIIDNIKLEIKELNDNTLQVTVNIHFARYKDMYKDINIP